MLHFGAIFQSFTGFIPQVNRCPDGFNIGHAGEGREKDTPDDFGIGEVITEGGTGPICGIATVKGEIGEVTEVRKKIAEGFEAVIPYGGLQIIKTGCGASVEALPEKIELTFNVGIGDCTGKLEIIIRCEKGDGFILRNRHGVKSNKLLQSRGDG